MSSSTPSGRAPSRVPTQAPEMPRAASGVSNRQPVSTPLIEVSRSVGHEQGTAFEMLRGGQDAGHFLPAEDQRKLLLLAGKGMSSSKPVRFKVLA
jgi:hypothetical protein